MLGQLEKKQTKKERNGLQPCWENMTLGSTSLAASLVKLIICSGYIKVFMINDLHWMIWWDLLSYFSFKNLDGPTRTTLGSDMRCGI